MKGTSGPEYFDANGKEMCRYIFHYGEWKQHLQCEYSNFIYHTIPLVNLHMYSEHLY